MRKQYIGLWSLLAVAFAVVLMASSSDTVTLFGCEFRTSGMLAKLTEPRDMPDEVAVTDTVPVVAVPVPVDTAAQRILLIGDSMLEGLSPRMAAYAARNGHELSTVIWYSSTSEIWGGCDTLSTFIRRYRPTYVMVCLGANELFVRDIARKRDRYVKHILRQIGDLPYLWIGPPNWKDDTGINSLVAANVKPGSFFLSDGMHFDRTSDGAHPTRRSAAEWLDSVARWMPGHSNHPIRMEFPAADVTAKAKRVIVLQPTQ